MDNRLRTYEYLRQYAWNSLWSKRILAELGFLLEMSRVEENGMDAQLLPVLEMLLNGFRAEGVITKSAALEAERLLMPLSEKAKEYEVTCAAHAHIDMNWLWGFQETASLTVDTFATVLKLMQDYPTFTFSQSQASVYHLLEQYHPQMLEQVRRRVHEGRWEVTASTWVENDKNMTGSEAMARQLLYTKRYLARLLEIPEDAVKLDFEPDTFGHACQLPEVLTQAGVKYYYHCRGMDGPFIYNWRAPSGAEVLVYREPAWYNQTIEYDLLLNVPSFCHTNRTRQYLKVYGVGDHGGGPTRRDLDRLIEMSSWPLFPTISFGTIHGFFEKLEEDRANFPVVDTELNYVFTGCYTSQARTKQANRIGEERLMASETLDSMARCFCEDYQTASAFEPAWQKVLFNQFHDILPGSGVRETREYALGQFQQALATADINANHAMDAICASLDTSVLAQDCAESTSVGAGVGYGIGEQCGYGFPAAERGCGTERAYVLFNTTPYPRRAVAELNVWDWQGDTSRMCAFNAAGERIRLQVLSEGNFYWGHRGTKISVPVQLPAMGYTSIFLRSDAPEHVQWPVFPEPRVDRITDEPIVLENKKIKAVFSPNTMELLSLVSKQTGQEWINVPSGFFCLGVEEVSNSMTAWRVGRFSKQTNLSQACPVKVTAINKGSVCQSIDFSIPFEASELKASVVLEEENARLRYNVSVDWNETGSLATGVPQLNFQLHLANTVESSRCVVPFGVIDRPALKQDVPCIGLIAGADNDETVALMSDCKYGFRNEAGRLTVNLIRASFDPDPKPEIGSHSFSLGIYVGPGTADRLIEESVCFANPVVSHAAGIHAGTLPLENSLVTAHGCILCAVKQAEEGDALVLRVYNTKSEPSNSRLEFCRNVSSAQRLAIPEWPTNEVCETVGKCVSLALRPHGIATVCVRF